MELVGQAKGHCDGELQETRVLLLHVVVQLVCSVKGLQEPAAQAPTLPTTLQQSA